MTTPQNADISRRNIRVNDIMTAHKAVFNNAEGRIMTIPDCIIDILDANEVKTVTLAAATVTTDIIVSGVWETPIEEVKVAWNDSGVTLTNNSPTGIITSTVPVNDDLVVTYTVNNSNVSSGDIVIAKIQETFALNQPYPISVSVRSVGDGQFALNVVTPPSKKGILNGFSIYYTIVKDVVQ